MRGVLTGARVPHHVSEARQQRRPGEARRLAVMAAAKPGETPTYVFGASIID